MGLDKSLFAYANLYIFKNKTLIKIIFKNKFYDIVDIFFFINLS